MATKYWLGTATAVAHVNQIGIATFDASTTYGITIGGVTISTAGNTDVETTTDDLVVLLNASTHPYFSSVTWSRDGSGASSDVRGTADVAGVPFTMTSYANGGTGTWDGGVTAIDPSAGGPNDWSTPENWSGGTVPTNSDDVVISDSSVNICWGLNQSSVTLASLTIEKSYTGRIGLDYRAFTTSANGAAVNAAKPEYRENYLRISATKVDIGENYGPTNPAGSGRILLNLGSNQAAIVIHDTASPSADSGRNAVRILNTHASSTLSVISAPGGVGVATEEPGETSTLSVIRSDAASSGSRLEVGSGVTVTTYYQAGGTNQFNAAATVTTMTMDGGILTTSGDYTVTTFNMNAGTLNLSHNKSAGVAVTTLNLNGGKVDTTKSGTSRTITTLNLSEKGGVFLGNGSTVTITTLAEPSNPYTITMGKP